MLFTAEYERMCFVSVGFNYPLRRGKPRHRSRKGEALKKS